MDPTISFDGFLGNGSRHHQKRLGRWIFAPHSFPFLFSIAQINDIDPVTVVKGDSGQTFLVCISVEIIIFCSSQGVVQVMQRASELLVNIFRIFIKNAGTTFKSLCYRDRGVRHEERRGIAIIYQVSSRFTFNGRIPTVKKLHQKCPSVIIPHSLEYFYPNSSELTVQRIADLRSFISTVRSVRIHAATFHPGQPAQLQATTRAIP